MRPDDLVHNEVNCRLRQTGGWMLSGVLALASSSMPAGAADHFWDGNCDDIPPQRWHCTCSAPGFGSCNGGGTSNWNTDVIPAAGDTAIIPGGTGRVRIDNDASVGTLIAASGIDLDFYNLTLTGANSSIDGLELDSQGTLWVDNQLALTGDTSVTRVLHGPGTVTSGGSLDLSSATLRSGVTFKNQGLASITSGDLQFGIGDGKLDNEGILSVGSNLDIEGPNGLIENTGTLSFQGPGDSSVLSVDFIQTTGDLNINGGKVKMESLVIDLQGGTVDIVTGATLEINSSLGGPADRKFNGINSVTGGGLLDVLEPITVAVPMILRLGAGFPVGGSGGARLQSTVFLDADMENGLGRRLRFRFATIDGNVAGVKLVNRGEAYTISTGNVTFKEVTFENRQNFSMLGPGVVLDEAGYIENTDLVQIQDGDISYSGALLWPGRFTNWRTVMMFGANPTIDSNISVEFKAETGSRVWVLEGILRFTSAVVNLVAGSLTDGTWIVEQGGRLEFPGPITELNGGCHIQLEGNGTIPQLVSLERIRNSGKLTLDYDATLDLTNPLTIDEGSELVVGDGVTLTTSGEIQVGEPDDSVIPELGGIFGGGGDSPDGPSAAVITASSVENGYGRVLPGARGGVGVLGIDGDYNQGASGRLHIDVATTGGDSLAVDGEVTLDGILELDRLDGVVPGTEFEILTVTNGSIGGVFDGVVSHDAYTVTYQPTSVTVTFDENLSDIFLDDFESGDTTAWSSQFP